MTLGSWDPAAEEASHHLTLSASLLDQLASYSAKDQLDHLDSLLGAQEVQRLSGLMRIEAPAWEAAVADRDETAIRHLIRFLTVAENLPGWEAGADSPVIPLARCLRNRGVRLDREFQQWIREVSDNRFLPYGPL